MKWGKSIFAKRKVFHLAVSQEARFNEEKGGETKKKKKKKKWESESFARRREGRGTLSAIQVTIGGNSEVRGGIMTGRDREATNGRLRFRGSQLCGADSLLQTSSDRTSAGRVWINQRRGKVGV